MTSIRLRGELTRRVGADGAGLDMDTAVMKLVPYLVAEQALQPRFRTGRGLSWLKARPPILAGHLVDRMTC